jgi:hypothetical protein
VAGLLGALAMTAICVVFIVSFIGGLHAPGPRSVPVGLAGSPAQASAVRSALSHQAPGAFVIRRYPTETAAVNAIITRNVDAALVPGPHVQRLVVATAVSEAETDAIIKVFGAGAARTGAHLAVQNIRPLHPGDPQGLSQTFFITALMVPSLIFGNLMVSQLSPNLDTHWQLAVIAVYAAIVSAVATTAADAGIGALTGAPWGMFGVGTLLAFAAAMVGAAASRWARGLVFPVFVLLFVPVGISSSGTTIGPRMITQWYADLGQALPPGATLPAVRNITYFGGNAIIFPLLVLSAWALAGIIAMVLVILLRPPKPGQPR